MPPWLDDPADLQAAAAIASFLVTLILAILTYVYVKDSRRMADQMVQQGEPVVVGRIEPFGQLIAQYVLTNVGLGPALNVEMKLRIDHEAMWRDALLEPGKSEFFFLPIDPPASSDFTSLADNRKVLTGTLTYEDRGGRTFGPTEIRVDFHRLNADWVNAHWQIRKSDVLQHAEELHKAVDDLTEQTQAIAKVLRENLPPLTTPTGLALSVTALRNMRHVLAGTDRMEPIHPLYGRHDVLVEVLGIDRKTAFRIWNFFRGHGGVPTLEEVEGVTPELAQRIRGSFRAEQL
ncbi:MAG TPA: hypothetical protein VJ840_00850 [Gemmatimonadaceae bacterium]|nr:hypothetical protein [Gemmatimonadaceae bacterium]